jgi:hypothetical protein
MDYGMAGLSERATRGSCRMADVHSLRLGLQEVWQLRPSATKDFGNSSDRSGKNQVCRRILSTWTI